MNSKALFVALAATTVAIAASGCATPTDAEEGGSDERLVAPQFRPVWRDNAAWLAAENQGGGFTAPPPPGSLCAVGARDYKLDLATRRLTWSACELDAEAHVLRKFPGARLLSEAEVEKVVGAVKTTRETWAGGPCGADKPLLTLTVGLPSGGTTYKDDFYACTGSGPFVTNIDAVLAAFGSVAVDAPPATVLPPDATLLVAHSAGGGFTPPPAPGSECAIGAQDYKLDLATRKLTWATCEFKSWDSPLTLARGVRTITSAELAQVAAAARGVEVTQEQVCGADKPYLTMSVTSPAGTVTYKDSFYSCSGDGPFVDHIDGLFSAFARVAR